jgi:hypothetical protein
VTVEGKRIYKKKKKKICENKLSIEDQYNPEKEKLGFKNRKSSFQKEKTVYIAPALFFPHFIFIHANIFRLSKTQFRAKLTLLVAFYTRFL